MSEPFPKPPEDQFSYLFFGHVSFAFSDGAKVVVVDPFFCGEFDWQGRHEIHQNPPTIAPSSIPADVVLISHEHRDHWDPRTVNAFLANPDTLAYAPDKTIADMAAAGVDRTRVCSVERHMSMAVGGMTVSIFPSVECDAGPLERVGFLLECDGRAIYHQGDSHGPAPSWADFARRLDALIIWPVYVDSYVYKLRPPNVILHHMDHFEPGTFFCSKDPDKELDYWRYRHPGTNWTAPPRNQWLPVPAR